MKNWLLVASFVLRCQFQNSTLAMLCEKIKVGFHYLNFTYSQTSYLGISWSKNVKEISIIIIIIIVFICINYNYVQRRSLQHWHDYNYNTMLQC